MLDSRHLRSPNCTAAIIAALALVALGCTSETKSGGPPAGAISGPTLQQPSNTPAGETNKNTDRLHEQSADAQSTQVASNSAAKSTGQRIEQTVYFRGDSGPAKMPKVLLSAGEDKLCNVKVGSAMPAIELPQVDGGKNAKLSDLFGKTATVVIFWKGDRRMATEQLADVGPDVIDPFGKSGVAVVGIAVDEKPEAAAATLEKAGAKFTNLVDADGKAFAKVGSDHLPRTYVLDASGKVVWFDIEYSLTTRRDLHHALRVLTEAK